MGVGEDKPEIFYSEMSWDQFRRAITKVFSHDVQKNYILVDAGVFPTTNNFFFKFKRKPDGDDKGHEGLPESVQK